MLRIVPVTAALISALVVTVGSAVADDSVSIGSQGQGSRIGGVVQQRSAQPTPSSTRVTQTASRSGTGGSSSGGSVPVEPQVKVSANDRRIIWTHPNGSKMTLINSTTEDYCRGSVNHVTCYAPYELDEPEPGRPGRQAPAPPPPPPPSLIAEQTIIDLPLPEPEPEIDPGWAITGLKAFLETGTSTTHDFGTLPTVLGPLRVTATSTYTVDWGDGTTTGPHSSPGGPYPRGDVTHVYRNTGAVDVTVTQNWTATWSLARQSGTVPGLSTSGTIDDLPVEEVQAIRRR